VVINQTDTVIIVARITSISIIIASKVEPVVSYIFALNPVKPINIKSFGFHKHICQVKKDECSR